MNKILRCDHLIFIFLLLAGMNAFANNLNEQPDTLEAKSRLEQIVTKKIQDRISTQLPKDTFNVGVQVTFEDKSGLSTTAASGMDIPGDIAMGIVDYTDVSQVSALKKIKIKKVVVLVGLHSKLGDEYKSKFESWLKTNVRSEFGNIGSAVVSRLPDVPDEVITEKSAPPRQLNWEERFGNFQNLIGLLVLAVLFIIGLVIFKRMPSSDAKEQLAVQLRIEEMKNSQLQVNGRKEQKKLESKEKPDSENQLHANLIFDHYRDHQRKVALIAISSHEKIDQALDLWLEEGDAGKRKIASFVDAVLSYGASRFNNLSHQESVAPESLSWALPEKIKSNKEMPPVFREFARLSLSEKTTYLEQSYWDLLSVKSLNEKTLKMRFSSLSQLPSAKIQKILSSQDKKVKSLTLLHLPTEKLSEVIKEMSYDDKKSVIMQAFELPKVRENELEVLDEALRFLVKKEESIEEGATEVQSMIPNILMHLKPYEEIKLIREICSNLADKGFSLKQSYPSVAFLGEWPKDKISTLLRGASNPEMQSLLQVFPDLKETILESLPPRTKMILQDQLGKEVYKEDELDIHLEGIKYRIFKLVNDGDLQLTQIFKATEPASSAKAA